MLEPHDGPGGLRVYRSRLLLELGVRHGFSTRLGGVSQGDFASLNLGLGPETPASEELCVRENLALFCRAIGLDPARLMRARQVHGAGVWCSGDPAADPATCQADALISRDPSAGVAVRTADCVPVLVARNDGTSVAAIHAGWRGLVAGVIPRAMQTLLAPGEHPRDFVAAIGPCIGPGAFEVGEEVAQAFTGIGLTDCVIRGPGPRPHIDLPAAARRQLMDFGVPAGQIDTTDRCTYRDAGEFFSHRRDRGRTGRLLAAIAPRLKTRLVAGLSGKPKA